MPAVSLKVSIAYPNYSRRYVACIEVCVLDGWSRNWDRCDVNEMEEISVIIFLNCL